MDSVWKMLSQGGIMMIPLIFTSILALSVVIERALYLRRRRIIQPDVLNLIQRLDNPDELDKVIEGFDRKRNTPFLNIIRTALEHRGETREEIREAILDQGRRETREMERGLAVLETVAGIAPLMGLLGTVLGMIKVFNVVSEMGLGQTQALSGGISEALITTVVGLAIAIPALVAYNYFTHKVEDMVLEIENQSSTFLKKLG